MLPRAAISWSGGKDSCAALHRTRADFDIVSMVTMFDEDAARSRSHGLRPEVLAAQADRLGLRHVIGRCTWRSYNAAFDDALARVKADGVTHVIFGDILFEDHRQWAEQMCGAQGLTAVEPLFGSPTETLFEEWTASGADALIVTTRAALLDSSWLGRPLRREMLAEFTRLGVDPCGERGEYHTLVTRSPLFRAPLLVSSNGHVRRSDCWALDVLLDDAGMRPEESAHVARR
ncbi:MAG: diphthine--ammonia ligase [Acidobacteria bacterium]|nr:diphthine--ammonia ligase [Acidobacteriota bacterium]